MAKNPPDQEHIDDEVERQRSSACDAMREWFLRNFEDPAESTPYSTAEGGYIYVNGGPYDAWEVLSEQFAGDFPDDWIEELAETISADGPDWAPTSEYMSKVDYLTNDLDTDESEIPPVKKTVFSQAVLSSSDWTTDTIITQIDKGNIILDPKFQRRDAWTASRKSQFIESVILGLPVPQLVLAERKEKKGSYIVIDGKQRLLSLKQFTQSDDPQGGYFPLKLTSLNTLKEIAGKSYQDLSNDPAFDEVVTAFDNHTIRTVIIKNWQEENLLYLIFLRLNTGSLPLAPQELRQALLPGPFTDFVDKAASESRTLKDLLKISKPDFRMRDVELLIRYVGLKFFIDSYDGNLKRFLDVTCERLNQKWSTQEQRILQEMQEFEEAYEFLKRIFGRGKVCTKPDHRRFNRALFDVLFYYFSDPAIRSLAVSNDQKIRRAFDDLFAQSPEFVQAVERTTKSVGALQTRLGIWGETLARAIGSQIDVPQVGR